MKTKNEQYKTEKDYDTQYIEISIDARAAHHSSGGRMGADAVDQRQLHRNTQ
jgi:hypothetical protein